MSHFFTRKGVPLYVINRTPKRARNPDVVAMAISGAILFVFVVYGFLQFWSAQ